ncbi:MAG TPA: CocE/NonD family hydrolase, partial [Pseudomonadota bacterium]|nr:CocE/NonD family hydrolase [Pseudomonadota bacterium]
MNTNENTSELSLRLALSPQRAPVDYDRAPGDHAMIAEKDVLVAMRDGVRIAVDVYRPAVAQPVPALLAFSVHNKDLQGPDAAAASLTQPAWSTLWTGPAEAGDTRFFVARGYAHVIGNPRAVGKSEAGKSEAGGSRAFDSYDLIEWIAAQPWCDGNVGMVGISGFGAEQLMAAKLAPPHLKAIFPFDPRGAYGEAGGFRDEYPGGVIHLFRFLLAVYAAAHQHKGQPQTLSPEREKLWEAAMANPDF